MPIEVLDVDAELARLRNERRIKARSSDRRVLQDVRRVRAQRVKELRAVEWRFDLHPTARTANELATLREEITDLERQMVELQ